MRDIYSTNRATGPSYRSKPGLWYTRPSEQKSGAGFLIWLGRIVLLMIVVAGLTLLILASTGA